MRRETVMTFGAKLPPGIVAMEACITWVVLWPQKATRSD